MSTRVFSGLWFLVYLPCVNYKWTRTATTAAPAGHRSPHRTLATTKMYIQCSGFPKTRRVKYKNHKSIDYQEIHCKPLVLFFNTVNDNT